MKLKYLILLIGLFSICVVGTVSASEDKDTPNVGEAISTIDDSRTAIDITIEGNKDIKSLQEDPTNTTRLKEAVIKPFNILFGGDVQDPNKVAGAVYGWIVFALFLSIFGLIMTFIITVLHGAGINF